MMPNPIHSKKPKKNPTFFHSFLYACQGIQTAFKEERNIRSHFVSAIIVIIMGFLFSLTAVEWALLILVIFLVIILELVNTIVENLVDFVTEDYHPKAKKIKDMAAASVLLTSILAAIIGILIFGRHVIELLNR